MTELPVSYIVLCQNSKETSYVKFLTDKTQVKQEKYPYFHFVIIMPTNHGHRLFKEVPEDCQGLPQISFTDWEYVFLTTKLMNKTI